MTDTIEAVADLIYPAINGPREAAVAIARQAIAYTTKALIEGAGDVEHNLIASTAQRTFGGDHCFASVPLLNQAAATIAAMKAEIERLTEREAQVKLDGVRAGIEAAKEEWTDSWTIFECRIGALDAEAIAKGIITADALSDLIAECTFFLDKPDTLADSDGDDGA